MIRSAVNISAGPTTSCSGPERSSRPDGSRFCDSASSAACSRAAVSAPVPRFWFVALKNAALGAPVIGSASIAIAASSSV